jgi:hypothetical protein
MLVKQAEGWACPDRPVANFCISHLIEKIHFDKNNPENHNVYISNLPSGQPLEEWIENGNKFPKMMNKFNTYVGIKDNNIVINKIKDEIKMLLYNNRNIINKELIE